jgi:hypothetical protein
VREEVTKWNFSTSDSISVTQGKEKAWVYISTFMDADALEGLSRAATEAAVEQRRAAPEAPA